MSLSLLSKSRQVNANTAPAMTGQALGSWQAGRPARSAFRQHHLRSLRCVGLHVKRNASFMMQQEHAARRKELVPFTSEHPKPQTPKPQSLTPYLQQSQNPSLGFALDSEMLRLKCLKDLKGYPLKIKPLKRELYSLYYFINIYIYIYIYRGLLWVLEKDFYGILDRALADERASFSVPGHVTWYNMHIICMYIYICIHVYIYIYI